MNNLSVKSFELKSRFYRNSTKESQAKMEFKKRLSVMGTLENVQSFLNKPTTLMAKAEEIKR